MKKILLIFFIISFFGIIYIQSKPDGKIHITICDVGQGDGIIVRSPTGKNILIDGGPDSKILSCLGQKTPWLNNSITTIIVSHLHADHINGITDVIKRYGGKDILINTIDQQTPEVKELFKQIENKHLKKTELRSGAQIVFDEDLRGTVYYPSENSWNHETGQWSSYLNDFNDSSTVFSLRYKDLFILFTGDAGKDILDSVASQEEFLKQVRNAKIKVLKVPHHGSRDAVSAKLVNVMHPNVAVISVGSKNTFGHPSEEAISILKTENTRQLRTDLQGDIEISSDGNNAWIKTDK